MINELVDLKKNNEDDLEDELTNKYSKYYNGYESSDFTSKNNTENCGIILKYQIFLRYGGSSYINSV
jgi:hypothetical protein